MLVRMTHNNEVREVADVVAQKLIQAGKAVEVPADTPKTK
jgi:hypothetical protein